MSTNVIPLMQKFADSGTGTPSSKNRFNAEEHNFALILQNRTAEQPKKIPGSSTTPQTILPPTPPAVEKQPTPAKSKEPSLDQATSNTKESSSKKQDIPSSRPANDSPKSEHEPIPKETNNNHSAQNNELGKIEAANSPSDIKQSLFELSELSPSPLSVIAVPLQGAAENIALPDDLSATIAAQLAALFQKEGDALDLSPKNNGEEVDMTTLLLSSDQNIQEPGERALPLSRTLFKTDNTTAGHVPDTQETFSSSQNTSALIERFTSIQTNISPVQNSNTSENSVTHLLHGISDLTNIRHLNGFSSRPATPQLPITTLTGQQGWAEEVSNRVVWMLGRAESKAELILTPPNLGKVEVSINLSGDQTTAQFIASSQAARDALEQALPRLREILQQAGIALGQTDVSTANHQQSSTEDSENTAHQTGTVSPASLSEETNTGSQPRWIKQNEGMVDIFA